MVAVDNLIGLIVFIVFILARLLGEKKPPPPKRQPRPPVQRQDTPAKSKPRPVTVAPPESVEDDFFPIPDDIREIFGLPPKPVQEKIKRVEAQLEVKKEQKEDAFRIQEPVTNLKKSTAFAPREREVDTSSSTVTPKLVFNKNTAVQGVIWAEILHNPRTNRYGRYTRHTR